MPAFTTDADISTITSGTSREARLQAAGHALALILSEVGDDAAIVLLAASIDAVTDRIRAAAERRRARPTR